MSSNKPLVPTRNGEAPLLAAQRRRSTSQIMKVTHVCVAIILGANCASAMSDVSSELRYTCDPTARLIELHLAVFDVFEGDDKKLVGISVPWEETIPQNSSAKKSLSFECQLKSTKYLVTVTSYWEGDLNEVHIDGQRFFPAVEITTAEHVVLPKTVMGVCQSLADCQKGWAVSVILVSPESGERPLVRARRLYGDWVSP